MPSNRVIYFARFVFVFFLTNIVVLGFSSCGSLNEKFGRLNSTTLHLDVTQNRGISTQAWIGTARQIIIYVVETSGTGFAAAVPLSFGSGVTSASTSLTVPNGTYHGYAIAWDSANLTGFVGCWQDTGSHILSGGSDSFNILIESTIAKCNFAGGSNGPFGDTTYSSASNFNSLTIGSCMTTPTAAATCTGGGSATTATYASGSVLIEMEGYNNSSGGGSLQGACLNLSAGTVNTGRPIPVGSSNAAFDKFLYTTVYFYTAASCSGTPGLRVRYPKGIINGSTDAGSALNPGNTLLVNVGG